MSKKVLVLDIGKVSGSAAVGGIVDGKLLLRTLYRFANKPINLGDTVYWDITDLFGKIEKGMAFAVSEGGFDSAAVDSWGSDFVLVGKKGNMLEAPIKNREDNAADVFEYAFQNVAPGEFYDITGCRLMRSNTVFQLMSLRKEHGSLLEKTSKILLIPDFFNYLLTGEIRTELSAASTTQLIDIRRMNWSPALLGKTGFPREFFPEMISAGKTVGTLANALCEKLNIPAVRVTAVCSHDLRSAAAAVPAVEEEFVFMVSGEKFAFGTVTDIPVINEMSYRFNLTNEVGYGGKISFMKNFNGLSLLYEARRHWQRECVDADFELLASHAKNAKPFRCFVDANCPDFSYPGNIPRRIREFCRRTDQYVPGEQAETVRCIYESIVFGIRRAFDEIRLCTRKYYGRIYVVGEGSDSDLLCQMAANACGCEIAAGPADAAAYGNAAVQLIALGEIPSLKEAGRMIAAAGNIRFYFPQEREKWEEAYSRYCEIVGK